MFNMSANASRYSLKKKKKKILSRKFAVKLPEPELKVTPLGRQWRWTKLAPVGIINWNLAESQGSFLPFWRWEKEGKARSNGNRSRGEKWTDLKGRVVLNGARGLHFRVSDPKFKRPVSSLLLSTAEGEKKKRKKRQNAQSKLGESWLSDGDVDSIYRISANRFACLHFRVKENLKKFSSRT